MSNTAIGRLSTTLLSCKYKHQQTVLLDMQVSIALHEKLFSRVLLDSELSNDTAQSWSSDGTALSP